MEFCPDRQTFNDIENWKAIIAIDTERTGPRPTHHYMNALGMRVIFIKDILSENETFDPKSHIKMGSSKLFILQAPSDEHTFDANTKAQFWDAPENAKLLAEWEPIAINAVAQMHHFLFFLNLTCKHYPRHMIITDCASDIFWIDHYIVQYTGVNPLHMDENRYRGGPFVTDDTYRGFLGVSDLWGLDDKIDKLTGYVPKAYGTPHDPEYDATIIGIRYALFMGLLMKPKVIPN